MSTKPFDPHDSIRVVPLYQVKEKIKLQELKVAKKKVKAKPKLTYRGGPLLSTVEVFTIFWGADWESPEMKDTAGKINAFFQTILQSTLPDQLSEYSTTAYRIGKGTLKGSSTLTADAPAQSLTDTQLQAQLLDWIQNNAAFPKPGKNTLYFVYLESGVTITMGGSTSCSSFCGYHNNADPTTFYAVMPYPDCSGCLGRLQPFDALTATSSHELCEAITDPIAGSGWYDDTYGEIGDICAWQFKTLAGYQVQLEWSNQYNKCL